MEVKKLHIYKLTREEIDRLNTLLPISEPFDKVLKSIDANNSRALRKFLSNKLGCSYRAAMLPIHKRGQEYLLINKYDILAMEGSPLYAVEMKDTGDFMGYTIPQFMELVEAMKIWKKVSTKIRGMEKENINPIKFKESNKVLKGGNDAEDLIVFNDEKVTVSCWRPTFMGRLKILFKGKIWLGIKNGTSQPPVWLTANYPFKG